MMRVIADGKPLSHSGRFAVVTFLHRIGMPVEDIAQLFKNGPKFNMNTTMYQIRHIIGEEGHVDYTPPTCVTMRTEGLCFAAGDPLCARVKHPLSYYKAKRRPKPKGI